MQGGSGGVARNFQCGLNLVSVRPTGLRQLRITTSSAPYNTGRDPRDLTGGNPGGDEIRGGERKQRRLPADVRSKDTDAGLDAITHLGTPVP